MFIRSDPSVVSNRYRFLLLHEGQESQNYCDDAGRALDEQYVGSGFQTCHVLSGNFSGISPSLFVKCYAATGMCSQDLRCSQRASNGTAVNAGLPALNATVDMPHVSQ